MNQKQANSSVQIDNPKKKGEVCTNKLVLRPFIQTPNEVVRKDQRPVFSNTWDRKCGNP